MNIVIADIDTQKDFMDATGALYVPGAESIKTNLRRLTEYAEQNNIFIYKTQDAHHEEDGELQRNGGPFPDHCMEGSEGALSIPETCSESGCSIYYKRCPDVFDEGLGSPDFENDMKERTEVVVYGVATDYCIKAAVLGLRRLHLTVYVVDDAIAGVAVKSAIEAINEMADAGAIFVSTDHVLGMKK